jgi:hypothetical protein
VGFQDVAFKARLTIITPLIGITIVVDVVKAFIIFFQTIIHFTYRVTKTNLSSEPMDTRVNTLFHDWPRVPPSQDLLSWLKNRKILISADPNTGSGLFETFFGLVVLELFFGMVSCCFLFLLLMMKLMRTTKI